VAGGQNRGAGANAEWKLWSDKKKLLMQQKIFYHVFDVKNSYKPNHPDHDKKLLYKRLPEYEKTARICYP
jgi:hypothetical protein